MRTAIDKLFLDHPRSVGEGYFEHLRFASRFSAGLFIAAAAALLHAVIPCLCEKTASNRIKELYALMQNR